jgi:preprotein translocase subunit SecY
MVDRLRSVWAAPDLRKKILLTIGLLIIFRLMSHIPVPGVDPKQVSQAFSNNQGLGQIFGLLSVFSGGSISTFSIVGIGIYPYITASIVIQLLQPIIPALERMGREGGESGRNQLSQITRYLTVPLAFLQGFGQLALFASIGAVSATQFGLFSGATFLPTLTTLIALTCGVMLLVRIGEIITENGIGNGISLIIFVNIIAGIPTSLSQFFLGNSGSSTANNGTSTILTLALAGIVIVVLVALIVLVTLAERRVPVQYPTKRMLGGRRAMMDTRQSTFIPLRVNQGGMIPLIFAQSLLLFPVILASYLGVASNPVVWMRNLFQWLQQQLDPSNWIYPVLFFVFVLLFTYFYSEVLWEQQNMSDNLRKQGAFIAGVRPGGATNEYLSKVLRRITLWGALFLALIAVMPFIFPTAFRLSRGATTGSGGLLTAASLIIIVQVAIDTVKQIQSQMLMRNYSGFLR